MAVTRKDFELVNPEGRIIDGYVNYRDDNKKKPLVLFQHGFKGFKEWGFFPHVCEQFAKSGAISVCYNFSLNGMRGSTDIVVRPEDFARMTVSNLLADLQHVQNSFINGEILEATFRDKLWNGQIYLVGHSMGGGLSAIHAANSQDINGLALWASISKFDRYTDRQKKFWKDQGYAEITNSRTKQVMKLYVTYYEDIDQNREQYDIRSAVANLKVPMLICHGTEDMTVRPAEAEQLASENDSAKLILIEKTAHTFSAVHPFEGTSEALEKLINETITFFGFNE